MTIHKNTKLTPIQRKGIWEDFTKKKMKIVNLARKYMVSRPTIYKVLSRARKREFTPRKSINERFRCLEYGFKRLSKIERNIEEQLKRKSKRYNKNYPGEMFHGDTKRLPLLENETKETKREYLFIAIDDFSRELYAGIYEDKSQFSSSKFLAQIISECPYTIEIYYTDNGTEYKGNSSHEFVSLCKERRIGQQFTKPKTPKTNGKAERVIRTILEMWHNKTHFKSREERKLDLVRFVNYYNTQKLHKGIGDITPHKKLLEYFEEKDKKKGS
jgi:transposase InsO family protein